MRPFCAIAPSHPTRTAATAARQMHMSRLREPFLFLLLLLPAACSVDDATRSQSLRVDRVVLISVDGLRGDALPEMPALSALLADAAWTDRARSVEPAVTLPAHLSMLTGRDVTELGVVSNTLDASAAATLLFSGVSTVFAWIDGASDAVVGASLLPPEQIETARALLSLRRVIPVGIDDAAIADAALQALVASDAPSLLFVHLPGVDLAGHTHGWLASATEDGALSSGYVAAVRAADAQIARLHAALAAEITSGNAALVVTADHGGGHGAGCGTAPATHEHCTAHPGDQLVPLVIVANGIDPGKLSGEPSITRIAPTIGALLGGDIADVDAPLLR